MPFELTKKWRGSISLRIAALFCLTFSLGIITAFLISYLQIRYTLEKSNREVLASKFHETAAILSSGDLHQLKDFFSVEKNRILNAPYMVRVLTPAGETLYLKPSVQEKNFNFSEAFKKTENPEKLLGWSSLAAIDDEDLFNIMTDKVGTQFYLQVGRSNEDHEEILGRIIESFGGIGGLFILLSAGIGIWYARKALLPLRSLLTTIKGIESGDLSKRVALSGSKGELHDLGETFNRMVSRIENLIQVMKESLDNVAHDIRTPLTRIRAVAEDALVSSNPIPLKEALEDCAESANHVSGIVDQLMSITEAEAGTLSLRREECDIRVLLLDVAEIYEFVAQEKEISVAVTCSANLTWSLDRKRIKQVIGNLLDNAIKFSTSNGNVEISAKSQGDSLRIDVVDQGVGISEADLTRIWDRLFRGDKSRTTKGSGLGLSIVRSIVMAHGGQAAAHINPQSGMTFSLVIPKINYSQT